MKKSILALSIIASTVSLSALATEVNTIEQLFVEDGKTVTTESYPIAESSHQFLKNQSLVGVNKFLHKRQLTPTDNQPVVRMNRDTYYSFAVVNVSKGASVTLPEIPKGKYMSSMVITEDHRIQPMQYGAGTYNLATHSGDHVYVGIRLDATFTEAEAKAIQDKMIINSGSDAKFTSVQYNKASFDKAENALKAQMGSIIKKDGSEALTGMFTAPTDASKELFTKQKHQVGSAIGWGGAQMVDNIYEISGNNPADVCHEMTFEYPKNKAFWSVTVYDKTGRMFSDYANMSSNTATPNKDGTFTVSFGCGDDAINNIPTANNTGVFNLGLRHYMPSQKVMDGYRLVPTLKASN